LNVSYALAPVKTCILSTALLQIALLSVIVIGVDGFTIATTSTRGLEHTNWPSIIIFGLSAVKVPVPGIDG